MDNRNTASWIRIEEFGEELFKCSNCGLGWFLAAGNPIENEMYYCPKCGSEMEKNIRGVDENDISDN